MVGNVVLKETAATAFAVVQIQCVLVGLVKCLHPGRRTRAWLRVGQGSCVRPLRIVRGAEVGCQALVSMDVVSLHLLLKALITLTGS